MAEYKISIIVQGEDRASKPLGAVGGALGRMGEIAGGILSAQVLSGIANGVINIGRAALDSVANYERLGMALQSLTARELLNSGQASEMTEAMSMAAGRAKELQGWITKLAIQSPFTSQGVADAFRMSMAYGFTTKESQRLTQAMIDFAAGSGASEESMSRIALALGQIKARGKLAGSEVLQLTNAGLDVRNILAKAFNVTTAELMEMQEKGLIPADKAIEAITQSLEHDFQGAAKASAGTFSGLLSSLKDIKEVGLREFFQGTFSAIQPYLVSFVEMLTSEEFMGSLRTIGEQVGVFVSNLLVGFSNLVTLFQNGGILTFFESLGLRLDLFVGWVQTSLPVIQLIFETVFNKVGTILSWLAAQIIPWLVEKFNQIGVWFVSNQPLIMSFMAALGLAFTNIIGVVANMWQFVKPLLDALIALLLGIAKVVMQAFVGDWTGAWQTVQNTLNTVVIFIRNALLMFVNWLLQSFAGQSLPEFLGIWQGIFNNISTITKTITDNVKKFISGIGATIDGVIQKVKDFIGNIIQMGKDLMSLKIPDWLVRHSPAPIEVVFGNWLDLTKKMNLELPALQNRLNLPAPAMIGAGSSSSSQDNRREYHLHLTTTQSPAVVQNSFDLMKVLDAA